MRKSLLVSAAVAALGIASATQAAIQVQYINRGTPQGSATQTSTGFTAYVVRLVESTGANISAVDAESGTNGLFGPFVQRWGDSDEDGVYSDKTINVANNPQNLSPNVFNNDSHLLFVGNPPADANYVGKIGFNEDVGGAAFLPSGSPNPPFPNNGTSGIVVSGPTGTIQAAFGIDGPQQSSVIDFAYVVLPNSFDGPLGTALIATAGGAPQLVTFPPVPEPTAMALAGVGALGLLARRRKA
jgi:hypothetical protein